VNLKTSVKIFSSGKTLSIKEEYSRSNKIRFSNEKATARAYPGEWLFD
jgi:hypothetical protein